MKKEEAKDLDKVTGGEGECPEPEEFDWKTKGYVTPVKEEKEDKGWKFSPIETIEEFFRKRLNK